MKSKIINCRDACGYCHIGQFETVRERTPNTFHAICYGNILQSRTFIECAICNSSNANKFQF